MLEPRLRRRRRHHLRLHGPPYGEAEGARDDVDHPRRCRRQRGDPLPLHALQDAPRGGRREELMRRAISTLALAATGLLLACGADTAPTAPGFISGCLAGPLQPTDVLQGSFS